MVTTSGQTVGKDSIDYLLGQIGDSPAEVLALTFHPGKLCIDRGMAFDEGVKGKANINVAYHEVVVPGQVEDGNAAAANWLTANQVAGDKKLAIWSCCDEPTQGAVAALRQAGGTDVITVSTNGSPQGVQLVKRGT